MRIALTSDETYSPGLLCAVLSILSFTRAGCTTGTTFHILDGGLKDETWGTLERKTSAFGENIRLLRHPLSRDLFTGLPLQWDGLPSHYDGAMAYARLLLPSLIPEDQVIFVDTDMLFFCDMQEIWDEPLGDHLIAACQDSNVMYLANDSLTELSEQERNLWYFSAGLMKVNLDLWRKEDVQHRTFQLLREYGPQCTWADQTALNACLKGRVKYLDRRWNRFSMKEFFLADFTGGDVNIHYIAHPKPWVKYEFKNLSYLIWRICWANLMRGGRYSQDNLGGAKGRLYDRLALVASWRGCGANIVTFFCALLKCVIWLPKTRRIHDWLIKQRTKLQIIQCVSHRLHNTTARTRGTNDCEHRRAKRLS